MPTYEFKCRECDSLASLTRKMDERNLPAECPSCGSEMSRTFSTAGHVLRGDGWARDGYKGWDGKPERV